MRVSVDLKKLEKLVKYTHKRVEMAERVLKDPSDENLIKYNEAAEVQADLRADLGIYPKLTTAEEAASAIWMARRDEIEGR